MPLPLVPLAVVGTGAALVVTGKATPNPGQLGADGGAQVSPGGAAPGSTIGDALQGGGKLPVGRHRPGQAAMEGFVGGFIVARPSATTLPPPQQAPYTNPNGDADKAKLDLIRTAGKKAYDKLDAAARRAAASELNKQYSFDPPLTGDETWDQLEARVANKIGHDVGAVAGGAVGAALFGPIGASVGAIIGAYLGQELGPMMAKGFDELKDWITGLGWDDVGNAIEDAAHYVGAAFSDIF